MKPLVRKEQRKQLPSDLLGHVLQNIFSVFGAVLCNVVYTMASLLSYLFAISHISN